MAKRKYSHYTTQTGEREYVQAASRDQAKYLLIRRYKKEHPNITIYVNRDEIKLEEAINPIRKYILQTTKGDPERYFAIGHGNPKAYNWGWINGRLLFRRGGTHGMNFGHEKLVDTYKGWYDPDMKIISIVVPERVTRGSKPNIADVPNRIIRELDRNFGVGNSIEVF
jgi:hypothetical protein